jgi:hypothetical protein
MRADNVLNPTLYRRLQQLFGTVKVPESSRGHAMIAVDRKRAGAMYYDISYSGECYRLNCPYCSDTRYRLYINHRYGARTNSGRKVTFLAYCQNENCLDQAENRDDLYDRLTELDGVLDAKVAPGIEVDWKNRIATLPGPCIRVDKLPANHKARAYLVSRKFDPDILGRFYRVYFCRESHHFNARRRLIIPAYHDGKLLGWQARYVGEVNWKEPEAPLKYFTMPGMHRSKMLYNIDNAKHYYTGVIVEGPFDVFAFGLPAVCTYGASMSRDQIRMFTSVFRRRSGVLLYDPDVYEDKHVQDVIGKLKHRMSANLACVKLPDNTDPGSLARRFLREYVIEEAKAQGVKVSFRKVA